MADNPKSQPGLLDLWRRPFAKIKGMERRLRVVNDSGVDVPLHVIGWWQDLADDRDIGGELRILPFTPETFFGEIIRGDRAVIYASTDERITPLVFLRSTGAHEIRHLEHNQKPWLLDLYVREQLIQRLLRADGMKNPDHEFFDRHHDELPEEVDAYVFEKEVAGFDGRPFAAAIRRAMRGEESWPNPERYKVRVTRPISTPGNSLNKRG